MTDLPSVKVYDEESKKDVSVTIDMQQKAVENHNKILSSANVIVNAVYDMASSLKTMRDEKLYLAYGCRSFRQYCDEKLEISRAQAYNYINVLEYFGEDGLKEKGHYGITKLKQIEKESKVKERKHEGLRESSISIINHAKVVIDSIIKIAELLKVKGTDEEKIIAVFDYFDSKGETSSLMDKEMVLGLLETSKKDVDEVMRNVNID